MNRTMWLAALAVSVLVVLPLAGEALAQSIGTLADIINTAKTSSTTYGQLPPPASPSSSIDITFKSLVNNIDDNTFLVDGMPATVSCANEVWRLTIAKAIRPDATATVSIRQGQSFTSGGTSGCLPPPNAPVVNDGNPDYSEASLTWTPLADAANLGITGYAVQYRQGTTGAWTTFNDGAIASTTKTVTGLSPNTGYQFRVAAMNNVGTGAPSAASATHTTGNAVAPNAPTNLLAVSNNSTSVLLTWDRPLYNGTNPGDGGSGITGYSIQYKLNGTSSWTNSTSTTTSKIIAGLNGSLWNFQVAAVNSIDTGMYFDGDPAVQEGYCGGIPGQRPKNCADQGSTTPSAKPGPPTGLDIIGTPGGQPTFTWNAATQGNSTITQYFIGGWSGVHWAPICPTPWPSEPPCTRTGADVGQRYFTARAQNSYGWGESRSLILDRPSPGTAVVPSQVTGLSASSTGPVISLDWKKPLSNGAAITDYNIHYRIGPTGTWVQYNDGTSTNTSANINLDYGTQYQIRVAAVNSVGAGSDSAAITYTTGPR